MVHLVSLPSHYRVVVMPHHRLLSHLLGQLRRTVPKKVPQLLPSMRVSCALLSFGSFRRCSRNRPMRSIALHRKLQGCPLLFRHRWRRMRLRSWRRLHRRRRSRRVANSHHSAWWRRRLGLSREREAALFRRWYKGGPTQLYCTWHFESDISARIRPDSAAGCHGISFRDHR